MTILPNMRLLGLQSSDSGQDWSTLATKIDLMIEEEGFDLAEETVVIEFRNGGTNVFRPVIGGLRELPSPWLLVDRISSRVELRTLDGEFWDEIMEQAETEDFTVLLKRRIGPELTLTAQLFSFF